MSDQTFNLDGTVAAITGGSGVLCSAMAAALARHGAKVALMARTAEKVAATAEAIKENGGEAIGVPCDVTDIDSVNAAKATIEEAWGPVTLLVNGAGGNQPKATAQQERFLPDSDPNQEGSFFNMDPQAFNAIMNLNVVGSLIPTQVFAKSMAESKSGQIINISSMSAYTPLTKVAGYSASKAAISNLTQWLSVHFAPVNVRVNAIAPGFFLTEQNRFLLTDEKTGDLTPRGNTIVSQTPMGRFGSPDDLDSTIVWLASEASRFITGIVVPVDGGFSAFSGV